MQPQPVYSSLATLLRTLTATMVFVQGFDISRLGLARRRANRLTAAHLIPQACSKLLTNDSSPSDGIRSWIGFNENEN